MRQLRYRACKELLEENDGKPSIEQLVSLSRTRERAAMEQLLETLGLAWNALEGKWSLEVGVMRLECTPNHLSDLLDRGDP